MQAYSPLLYSSSSPPSPPPLPLSLYLSFLCVSEADKADVTAESSSAPLEPCYRRQGLRSHFSWRASVQDVPTVGARENRGGLAQSNAHTHTHTRQTQSAIIHINTHSHVHTHTRTHTQRTRTKTIAYTHAHSNSPSLPCLSINKHCGFFLAPRLVVLFNFFTRSSPLINRLALKRCPFLGSGGL